MQPPAPHRVFDVPLEDGALTRVRLHGKLDAPIRIFLSHGNGFAIDGYYPFWGPLGADYELVVFDQRHHGWNDPVEGETLRYAWLARDLDKIWEGVTEELGAKPSVAAFHSMSGRASMKHAIEINWRWDALVLFDPPNIPEPGHPVYDVMIPFENRLAEWAEGRRDTFASPQEMSDEYRGLRVHADWVDAGYDLMGRAILKEQDDGAWKLAFPGKLEAQMYLENIPMNLWPKAVDFGGPVKLIAADHTVERPGATAIANKSLSEEGGYDTTVIPKGSHMLQMSYPDACRDAMLEFLGRHGLGA